MSKDLGKICLNEFSGNLYSEFGEEVLMFGNVGKISSIAATARGFRVLDLLRESQRVLRLKNSTNIMLAFACSRERLACNCFTSSTEDSMPVG